MACLLNLLKNNLGIMNKIDKSLIANKIAEDTKLIKSIEEKLVKQTFMIPVEIPHKKVILTNEC